MSFVPTAGAVKTAIVFTLNNQECINTIWCSRDAEWTQAQREALNTAIRDWWSATGKSLFCSNIALTQVVTTNQDASNSPSSTLIVAPIIAGTAAGTQVPNNVAVAATLRTALRGRSYRGRVYLAGMPITSLYDTISFSTTFVSNVIAALAALKTAIEALGAAWVVVSKFSNKVQRGAGLKTPVTAIAVDTLIDSQRRRLAGRGA